MNSKRAMATYCLKKKERNKRKSKGVGRKEGVLGLEESGQSPGLDKVLHSPDFCVQMEKPSGISQGPVHSGATGPHDTRPKDGTTAWAEEATLGSLPRALACSSEPAGAITTAQQSSHYLWQTRACVMAGHRTGKGRQRTGPRPEPRLKVLAAQSKAWGRRHIRDKARAGAQ